MQDDNEFKIEKQGMVRTKSNVATTAVCVVKFVRNKNQPMRCSHWTHWKAKATSWLNYL